MFCYWNFCFDIVKPLMQILALFPISGVSKNLYWHLFESQSQDQDYSSLKFTDQDQIQEIYFLHILNILSSFNSMDSSLSEEILSCSN